MPGSNIIANNIQSAADEIFRERGFERAEMRTIAQRAGIAVGTIYNYYPNKWGLFLKVLDEEWDKVVQKVNTVRAQAGTDWRKKLLTILDAQMNYVMRNGPIWAEIEGMAAAGQRMSAGGDPAAMRRVLDWLTTQISEVLSEAGRTEWKRSAARERFALALIATAGTLARRMPRERSENLKFLGGLLPPA